MSGFIPEYILELHSQLAGHWSPVTMIYIRCA